MKKYFGRAVSFLLAVVMLVSAVPFTGMQAFAANAGKCGDNLDWSLEGGVLSITGVGNMDDYAVSHTPWYAERDSIESVIISDGVTSVGNYAFYDCDKLSSVAMPSGLVSIGKGAFRDCYELKSIALPGGVVNIGDEAFYSTPIENITIPFSVAYVGTEAFGWCTELKKIIVEQGNENYSSDEFGVFFNADKTTLIKFPAYSEQRTYKIPETVENIVTYAFENCGNIDEITIPASVKSIEKDALFNCSASNYLVDGANEFYSSESGVIFNKDKSVLIQYPMCKDEGIYTVPASVTEIAYGAFSNSLNIRGIVLSDGVEVIGDEAFYFSERLEFVHIPSSVTKIGSYVIDSTDAYI